MIHFYGEVQPLRKGHHFSCVLGKVEKSAHPLLFQWDWRIPLSILTKSFLKYSKSSSVSSKSWDSSSSVVDRGSNSAPDLNTSSCCPPSQALLSKLQLGIKNDDSLFSVRQIFNVVINKFCPNSGLILRIVLKIHTKFSVTRLVHQ